MRDATLNDCYGCAVDIRQSKADVDNIEITNPSGRAIDATYASEINLNNATITGGSGYGVVAGSGSTINANEATITDNGSISAIARFGGTVSLYNATVIGHDNDIRCIEGGTEWASSCETSSSTDSGPHEDHVDFMGFDERHGIITDDFEMV